MDLQQPMTISVRHLDFSHMAENMAEIIVFFFKEKMFQKNRNNK